MNRQVILRHRSDVIRTRETWLMYMLDELDATTPR